MDPGDTFINRNVGSDRHLWIVTARCTEVGSVLAYNLTTYRKDKCDDTCIVQPGEHRLITTLSVVAYELGRILTPGIIRLLRNGRCTMHEPVSTTLLRRIQDGALRSIFTAGKHKDIIRAFLAAQDTLS